ncbi:MAG: PilW family protein [Pseudomonadota bacterium]
MRTLPNSVSLSYRQRGVSIIEVMLSVTLGLMLIGGVLKIFDTSKRSYRLTENLSRMQESARFSMDVLTKDLRMAGYMPCRIGGAGDIANTLNSTSSFFDFFGSALRGYEGGVSTFPAEFPAVGANPGDRVAGSDAVVILRGGTESYTITQHNPASAQFKLNNLHTLEDGDILLVCDANSAGIFQATNVNSSNKTVVHNIGTGSPGNCSVSIGGSGDCSDMSNLDDHTYGPGSQLVKFESYGYYIGVSNSGRTRSLYRLSLNVNSGAITASMVAEELLEDIENMQILYGIDNDADSDPEQYVTANNVTSWDEVIGVRVGLLNHTPDEVNEQNDTKTYNVVSTPIGASGTITHEADRRLRYVFSSTIKVRNRGLN